MSSVDPSVDPQAVEQTKRQIRGLVDEISALSKQKMSPEEYYPAFLQRVVEALAAVGGAVWTLTGNRQFQLEYQINFQKTSLDQPGEHVARHGQLLGKVAQTGEGILVPPHSGAGDETSAANPTEMLLVLAPLHSDEEIAGVVEIFQRPATQPATRRGYLRFLLQMCELAGEWLKGHRLTELGNRESMLTRVDNFARAVHESLDVRMTSYTIANEAQRLIGSDRISVAVRRGAKCKVEAVSGQDTFDARSNVVHLLGKLATKVVASGEPLWFTGSTDHLPPQVEQAVQEYVDHSHTKTVAVVPLAHASVDMDRGTSPEEERIEEPDYIGALIVEQVEDVRPQQELSPRIDLVAAHASRALSNAHDYNNIFLMPVWRTLGKTRWLFKAKTLPKTVSISVLILIVILLACLVPAQFDMEAEGIIQPVIKRDVFVETDGIVSDVPVKHGDMVKKDQVLVQLDSTEVNIRLAEVLGNLASIDEQLNKLTRQMIDPRGLQAAERVTIGGRIRELEVQRASYLQQIKLLEDKKAKLTVRSPIAGEVITWDVDRLLKERPVTTGNLLMTVVDCDQEWELEVYMEEKRMGHINQARKRMGEELDVTYIVATNPHEEFKGKVVEIEPGYEATEEYGHTATMRVDIDETDLKDRLQGIRPEATVTAKVNCGRRAIGFVWLHELFEWFQKKVIFKFF